MPVNPNQPAATIDVSAVHFAEIAPTLYSDIAEQAAKAVATAAADGKRNRRSQLRRFYDELVGFEARVRGNAERYAALAPYIQMMKAKAAYAQGRDFIDVNFAMLLRHLVDEIHDAQTLRSAKLFFEAFMAYYKLHGRD